VRRRRGRVDSDAAFFSAPRLNALTVIMRANRYSVRTSESSGAIFAKRRAGLARLHKAMEEVPASFDRFCLAGRNLKRSARSWRRTQSKPADRASHDRKPPRLSLELRGAKISFPAGKVDVERPRVRDFAGRELVLPI
jgi:hypothetical protein